MPKFGIQYVSFVTSTAKKSVIGQYLLTDLTHRSEVVEVICTGAGSVAAADIQHEVELQGFTGGGTGASTTVTPGKFRYDSAASLGNSGVNYTTEPTTITAATSGHPVSFGFNQRGGMRWAVPQGEGVTYSMSSPAAERIWSVQVLSSAAGTVTANTHFWQGN
jgi:hypothetical protein